MKIKVDVVSDVVCPWCYIGKRRLEKAMEQLKNKFEFGVHYLPFELNPQMPTGGQNQRSYLTTKFGGEERYRQLTERVTKIAASEGIQFHYEKQHVAPNTRNAHRLIWLASQYNLQTQVKEALMRAYFTEGADLTQNLTLETIGINQGLPAERLKGFLQSEEGIAEVVFAENLNHQRGITGVPFFIVNDKYGISGAQPTEAFIDAFQEIASVSVAEEKD